MRNEQDMMHLIIETARKNDRVRAVYQNGSRVNAKAPADIFQDYDIVYVVTEIASFLKKPDWINVFGDRLIMQKPDEVDMPHNLYASYGYLMLFTDGNRIDLRLQTIEEMKRTYERDSLTAPILDKDGILPVIPPPSDRSYHVQKPTAADYYRCTNEFWWCLQNVGKGIWREELPYAKQMFERIIRKELDQMISWWIGCKHQFHVSVGKMGKYFRHDLTHDQWLTYQSTYSSGETDDIWKSIFAACALFRELALNVAAQLDFIYAEEEERAMLHFLKSAQHLQKDAKTIF
ncbi:aminoglycoside 6-adenylyltransferase [Domibacillus enclensis]|uniref:Aminoglycoside 6-adenylyltransferase n=1 Tax=Domibacillus enclensis TaxID=1017273 RepID=A0A1N6V066_9BACI|nr:aminoglycoside 6-adenylyltransferase [Domibacillus enclensis]OXS78666.1 aminoglycoside 6-adenylyltransferase [Domibacillus enclensis]SIQ71248.1 aminoglycoside 6-adenylyltransferase [Domibacillus enclensis]